MQDPAFQRAGAKRHDLSPMHFRSCKEKMVCTFSFCPFSRKKDVMVVRGVQIWSKFLESAPCYPRPKS